MKVIKHKHTDNSVKHAAAAEVERSTHSMSAACNFHVFILYIGDIYIYMNLNELNVEFCILCTQTERGRGVWTVS